MAVTQDLIDEALATLEVLDIRSLKTGGQKTVRLVDRDGDQLVMKLIALEEGATDTLRRAEREVELLERLSHAHVVRAASPLTRLGEPLHGVTWLEEFLDGDDLSDCLGTPWTWDEAKVMATEVADGLSALHDVDVVHRDLSANNIRRTTDGRYVVMDPGYARHALRSSITVAGQPGTYGYLSPEHLGAYSGVPMQSSDVFCVGILLFMALTGQQPIPYTGDVSDYLSRLSRVDKQDVGALRPDLTAEQCELIRRILHAQPARRPRNGTRLREALEAIH